MAERFVIQGLKGKEALKGKIPVRGAKNAALKAIAASILFKDGIHIKNVPEIEDINRMLEIMTQIGASVDRKYGRLTIRVSDNARPRLPRVLSKRLRSSMVLTGPLLARFGAVSFPHPGGCLIGARPIDIFLKNYKKMGATVRVSGDRYDIRVPEGKLKGVDIFLRKPSVSTSVDVR